MKREELRKEIDEITNIFLSAKYYERDFEYINSIKFIHPVVYSTFRLFIGRIFHSVSVIMVLQLSKLFDKEEKFSFIKLKNKILNGYENSELNSYLPLHDAESIFNSINSEEIETILIKLKKTRDKYYAHLDRTRPDFSDIVLRINDTGLLISTAEKILKTIELKYFGTDVDFDLTIGELGHNIFDRLDDWEEYREKYGLIQKE